jgi:lysozyme family protein
MSKLLNIIKAFIASLSKKKMDTISIPTANITTITLTTSSTPPPLMVTTNEPELKPDIVTSPPIVDTSMDVFYSKILPLTLIFEGGFTDNPKDRGGRTNFGITQRVYDGYRRGKNLSYNDVKDISMEEVREIYYKDYYMPSKCSEMPEKISVVVFDTAVNSGVGRSIKTLQQAIGCKIDGSMGPETLLRFKDYLKNHDQMAFINSFTKIRDNFYHAIVERDFTQNIFLKGWLRRLNFLKDYINDVKTLEEIKKEW